LLQHDREFAVALSCLAALRVLLFAAAFPFFSNVDEQYHFDAILQFANGYKLSPNLPKFRPDSADTIALYQSLEFVRPATAEGLGWCHPTPDKVIVARFLQAHWRAQSNDEVLSPPVYYLAAAAWYKVGGWLGYSGVFHLYWARAFQALGYGFFVLFAFLFTKRCYPDNRFLQSALPLFLLFFPQDIFFSLNPNALFPLMVAASLWTIAGIVERPSQTYLGYLFVAAILAATFLLGYGNWVIAIPLAYALYLIGPYSQRSWMQRAALALAAGLPPFLWMLRNRLEVGDWMGAAPRLQLLGWTPKPLGQIFHHPIFTFSGLAYFLTTSVRNFWRGEIVWHGAVLTSWIDSFYFWSTLILFVVFCCHLLSGRRARGRLEGFADWSCLSVMLASVLFLVWLTMRFDFGACLYPSRAKPFFVSGRLVMGSLLPFAVIYLRGIQLAVGKLKHVDPLMVVALIVLTMAVTETWNMRSVFASNNGLYSILSKDCGSRVSEGLIQNTP
jgi:Predicted membrane protein (DUF2142)